MSSWPSSILLSALVASLSTGAAAPARALHAGWPSGASVAPVMTMRGPGPSEVLVPTSTFVMGSTAEELEFAVELCKREAPADELCEKPFSNELQAHEVTVSAYFIDRTEVTASAYRRCVEVGRCGAPPYAAGAERFDRADYPVVLVTWSDAADYCKFAGRRLPTEAEWERAARGVVRRRFPWGNLYNKHLANHGAFALDDTDDSDGFAELSPVGSFPAGRTPDGLDDMAGNAEEWVADAIDDPFAAHYPPASEVNPRGAPAGAFRVVRGGSYRRGAAWLRAAARGFRPAGDRDPARGFRCARAGKDD